MAINTAKFKQAIQQSLASCPAIVTATGHNNVSQHTGVADPKIHEWYPEFAATQDHVVFDVLTSDIYIPSQPLSGNYMSKVLIYAISENSEKTTYLADLLFNWFTCRPTPSLQWYRNISTDCITNKFTILRSRLRENMPWKFQTDHWVDGVEVDFLWHTGNCEGVQCELDIPPTCGIENSETSFSPDSCKQCE